MTRQDYERKEERLAKAKVWNQKRSHAKRKLLLFLSSARNESRKETSFGQSLPNTGCWRCRRSQTLDTVRKTEGQNILTDEPSIVFVWHFKLWENFEIKHLALFIITLIDLLCFMRPFKRFWTQLLTFTCSSVSEKAFTTFSPMWIIYPCESGIIKPVLF